MLLCCRVHERESERRIKSYRAAGKQQQPAHYSGQVLDTEQLGGDTLVKTRQQSGESESRTAADCDRNTATTTTPGRERGDTRGDGGDKAGDCTPATAAAAGFGSRNTFDRASQLRRSRKKSRRRSDAADTTVTPRRKSDAADATLSPSTAAEKMARSARQLSESLDQSSATNTTTVSTLSRLHEQTFTSRAEYSSNYGNLI